MAAHPGWSSRRSRSHRPVCSTPRISRWQSICVDGVSRRPHLAVRERARRLRPPLRPELAALVLIVVVKLLCAAGAAVLGPVPTLLAAAAEQGKRENREGERTLPEPGGGRGGYPSQGTISSLLVMCSPGQLQTPLLICETAQSV